MKKVILKKFILGFILIKNIWKNFFSKNFKILNEKESIQELITSKKGIVRFGDGELNYILGNPIWFQKPNKTLIRKLKNILNKYNSQEATYYIAMPKSIIHKEGNYNEAIPYWRSGRLAAINYMSFKNLYLSSFCFRFSNVIERPENNPTHYRILIKKLLKNENIIFVGDEASNYIKIKIQDFISTPPENAFDHYDDIFQNIKLKAALYPNPLVLISCGIVATILAAELNDAGILAYDIGTLFDKYYHDNLPIDWFD